MISRWKSGLEESSIKSLKCVFYAFHVAVTSISPKDESVSKKQEKSVYSVDTGSMYNQLMKMCLKDCYCTSKKNLSSTKMKYSNIQNCPTTCIQDSAIN